MSRLTSTCPPTQPSRHTWYGSPTTPMADWLSPPPTYEEATKSSSQSDIPTALYQTPTPPLTPTAPRSPSILRPTAPLDFTPSAQPSPCNTPTLYELPQINSFRPDASIHPSAPPSPIPSTHHSLNRESSRSATPVIASSPSTRDEAPLVLVTSLPPPPKDEKTKPLTKAVLVLGALGLIAVMLYLIARVVRNILG